MRVDREAMARSLLNLVNNALKYSQDRKYIGVKLYRDNGSVKLEVVDQGIGIPHQEQQKIFEKFYRAGDPLVHNTKGAAWAFRWCAISYRRMAARLQWKARRDRAANSPSCFR